eukprot:g24982.t1
MGKILNEYFSSVFTVEKDMKIFELGEVSGEMLGTVHIRGGVGSIRMYEEFFDEVTRKVDEGRAVDVVQMDFSKAFDKIPHGRLPWKGSVLGPLLFVIDINDFDENVQGMIDKFVDDTKISCTVDNEEGYQKLQQDLDQLGKWAEKW